MKPTQEQIAALVKRMKECLYGIKETDSLLIEAADMLEQLAQRKTYADGVKDAARVAEYEAEYVPLKPGDMTRAIMALLTEKPHE